MNKEELINQCIKVMGINPNKVSDGYHTFEELYDHRIALFIALCNLLAKAENDFGFPSTVWKSKKHSDGTSWDGWFIAGIKKKKGEQITYHLPLDKWKSLRIDELEKAPEWDGHSPADVIERLLKL